MAAAKEEKSAQGGKSAVAAAAIAQSGAQSSAQSGARASAPPSAPSSARLTNALAAASWAEADEALGEALVEFAGLERALAGKEDGTAREALAMTAQALSLAGRRRGLSMFGAAGARADFDEGLHQLVGAPSATRVRILRAGVMRGREVLIRALVAPVRKAAKRTPR